MQRIVHICALTLLVAGCGGGSAGEEGPSQAAQAPQFYRSCGYEYHEAGIVPSGYRYTCSIVGKCNTDDVCNNDWLAYFYPECQPGRNTCTACTPGGSC
jgi:hypothetical protein